MNITEKWELHGTYGNVDCVDINDIEFQIDKATYHDDKGNEKNGYYVYVYDFNASHTSNSESFTTLTEARKYQKQLIKEFKAGTLDLG